MTLVSYDQQIWLLFYYLRSNEMSIIEAINKQDKDSIQRHVKEILQSEFNVTDEKAVSHVIELFTEDDNNTMNSNKPNQTELDMLNALDELNNAFSKVNQLWESLDCDGKLLDILNSGDDVGFPFPQCFYEFSHEVSTWVENVKDKYNNTGNKG